METRLSKSNKQPLENLTRCSRDYAAWITEELRKIAVLFGETVSKERIALTVSELMAIDRKNLDKAFSEVRLKGHFFPKPSEVIEIIRRNPLASMIFTNDEKEK